MELLMQVAAMGQLLDTKPVEGQISTQSGSPETADAATETTDLSFPSLLLVQQQAMDKGESVNPEGKGELPVEQDNTENIDGSNLEDEDEVEEMPDDILIQNDDYNW